jgi:transcriptional regulator with XRE-family HTH domain
MGTKKMKPSEYVPARVRVTLTPGDSVRIAREIQEMTQAELAAASGVPQPTISSIESGRATLGAERAEKLARALSVHPAVLLWPQWRETYDEPSDSTDREIENAQRRAMKRRSA